MLVPFVAAFVDDPFPDFGRRVIFGGVGCGCLVDFTFGWGGHGAVMAKKILERKG